MALNLSGKIKPEQIPSEENGLANAEAKALAEGEDLKKDAEKREHGRKQELKDILVLGIKFFFWLFLIVVVVMSLTWVFHLLTPEGWHYLCPEQIDKIQTMLFSGITAAALSGVAKRYFLD